MEPGEGEQMWCGFPYAHSPHVWLSGGDCFHESWEWCSGHRVGWPAG